MASDRDANGRFVNGHPGGPGRPPGSAAREFREIVNGGITELIQGVLDQALEGNLQAARLVLDRTHPVSQGVILELSARIDELEGLLERQASQESPGQD